MRVRHRRLLFIVLPAIPILYVAPAALSLTPGLMQKGLELPPLLIVAPFWAGLILAPGYLRALTLLEEAPRPVPMWSVASVALAFVTSLGGAFAGLPILLPTPFALASAFCCVVLLLKHRQSERSLAALAGTGQHDNWIRLGSIGVFGVLLVRNVIKTFTLHPLATPFRSDNPLSWLWLTRPVGAALCVVAIIAVHRRWPSSYGWVALPFVLAFVRYAIWQREWGAP